MAKTSHLFKGEMSDRSLQFEFKLLTKFLLVTEHNTPENGRCARFAFNQIVKHLRIKPAILQKRITMPGLESRSAATELTLDQKSARYGSVRLQPKIGNLKDLLQKRGLSGLQSEDNSFTASCCLPYPNKNHGTEVLLSACCHQPL